MESEPQRPAATDNSVESAAESLKAGEPLPAGKAGGIPDDTSGILGMATTAPTAPGAIQGGGMPGVKSRVISGSAPGPRPPMGGKR